MNAYPSPRRGISVREDWRAWLPEHKDRLFQSCIQDLEASYMMLSVALNEAMELRGKGYIAKSFEAAKVTDGLCRRLTHSLESILGGLSRHAKHYGTVPNAAPLDPANFRGPRGQRTARLSGFLNRILLSQRAQFIHKATALHEMVADLEQDFCAAAEELVSGACTEPEALWDSLDKGHFDLNTCLRETYILLKSFLLVLPEDQQDLFETALKPQSQRPSKPSPVFRHRRFAAVPGK